MNFIIWTILVHDWDASLDHLFSVKNEQNPESKNSHIYDTCVLVCQAQSTNKSSDFWYLGRKTQKLSEKPYLHKKFSA